MRFKGTYPARDFIESVRDEVQARFIALAKQLARTGRLPDKKHGHPLKPPYSDIYELKPYDARLFGFFHKTQFYVVCGASKKKQNAQLTDYKRASDLRRDFLDGLARTTKKGT